MENPKIKWMIWGYPHGLENLRSAIWSLQLPQFFLSEEQFVLIPLEIARLIHIMVTLRQTKKARNIGTSRSKHWWFDKATVFLCSFYQGWRRPLQSWDQELRSDAQFVVILIHGKNRRFPDKLEGGYRGFNSMSTRPENHLRLYGFTSHPLFLLAKPTFCMSLWFQNSHCQ